MPHGINWLAEPNECGDHPKSHKLRSVQCWGGHTQMDRQELARLLAINYAVADALAGKKPKDPRMVHVDTLARKLFQHAVTAYALWTGGTRVDLKGIGPVDFPDWPSIEVLCRACIETYVACHYVFIQPDTDDEFEFRFNAWMLAGFAKRESFPVITDDGRAQIARDAKLNEKCRKRVQRTAAFQALNSKTKKAVLAGRGWPPGTTMSALADTVLGPRWGRAVYGVGSSHAHSDGLAAVQIKEAISRKEILKLIEATMPPVGLALACMTADYARKFVKARKVVQKEAFKAAREAVDGLRK